MDIQMDALKETERIVRETCLQPGQTVGNGGSHDTCAQWQHFTGAICRVHLHTPEVANPDCNVHTWAGGTVQLQPRAQSRTWISRWGIICIEKMEHVRMDEWAVVRRVHVWPRGQ